MKTKDHSLTGVFVGAGLAVIEYIPLTVNLAYRTMCISINNARGDGVALFVYLSSTSINYCAAIGPWTQWMVAVCISQCIIAGGQTEFSVTSEAAVDEYILILNFTYRRCLEETEYVTRLLLITGNHAINNLGSRLYGTHSGGIDFCTHRVPETPITIYLTIVINKHCGIKTIDSVNLHWVVSIPVANLKRSVGTVAFCNQTIAIPRLVIREEVVCLFTCAVGY